MRHLKSYPILGLLNFYMADSPQPVNISYLWNFGSLLGLCIIIQISTGLFLAMYYCPNMDLAFVSAEHLMRDVNYGWAIRYIHANTASFFFIFVYAHVVRGLYHGSYRSARVLLGSIIVVILGVMWKISLAEYFDIFFNFNNFYFTNVLYLSLVPIAPVDDKPELLTKVGKELLKYDSNISGTALVVWGSNLGSTVGYGRFTKVVKNMFQLPPYQESVVVGVLLSDANLASTKPHENPRLEFRQSFNNSAYVIFVFIILSHYCNAYPYLVTNVRKGVVHYGLSFYTRGLPCFNDCRKLFYDNKVKIVPKDIYNLLTPVALAHMIMGDATALAHGLLLCVDCYSVIDVVRLMNVLILRYNLDCTLRFHTPTQPRIYIRQRSMANLRELVKPHMHKSMLYKIGL